MTLNLGQPPDSLSIDVTSGLGFTATITAALNGLPWLWPTGTVLVLWFEGAGAFSGIITGADVTWTLTPAEVLAIPDNAHCRIDVTYPGKPPFRGWSGRVTRSS